ncbi:hypothetical protein [Aureispira sp. CCB-QB1]|uniref:hypothetical protein n=1 Tax=Aureispira sp. CCB-QB1 TaxID=1313421 RepID=UPI0012DE30C5|nr:hypothetical protein [Aureispira sp. CCB-QB1]
MKKLKKPKAKLPKDEEIVGKGVPNSMLNQERLKKLGKMKTKSKTTKKRRK